MREICDLHVHSYYSDGTCSPAELIELAQEAGLSAVALCDHNTVAGVPEFVEAARNRGVEAIPGIEFSTVYRDKELHILALFVAERYFEQITEMMTDFLRRKDASNENLARALNRAGYVVDYQAIKASTPNGQVNRAHIAMALTKAGYVSSPKEAFAKLLDPKHGYYTPPQRLSALDAIRYIKSIGAVAVLAHPFLSLDEAMLLEFLREAKDCGLDGMEVAYAKYDAETTALSTEIADAFELLPSGGSDFHGGNKPDIAIGVGRGDLAVPSGWINNLRCRAKNF